MRDSRRTGTMAKRVGIVIGVVLLAALATAGAPVGRATGSGAYAAVNLHTTDRFLLDINDMGQILSYDCLITTTGMPSCDTQLADGNTPLNVPLGVSAPAIDNYINTWGEVSGTSASIAPGFSRAATWTSSGGTVPAGSLGGDNSWGGLINEAGWTAGDSETTSGSGLPYQAYVSVPAVSMSSWPPLPPVTPGVYDLGHALGVYCSSVSWGGLNERGQVVGITGDTTNGCYGFLPWDPVVPAFWQFLPDGSLTGNFLNLAPGWSLVGGNGGSLLINNRGQVLSVGVDLSGNLGILLWEHPEDPSIPPADIGIPPTSGDVVRVSVDVVDGTTSNCEVSLPCVFMNDRGQVLATFPVRNNMFDAAGLQGLIAEPWLWDPSTGRWSPITPQPSCAWDPTGNPYCDFSMAYAINNAGQVGGENDHWGYDPNVAGNVVKSTGGFVWTAAGGQQTLPSCPTGCTIHPRIINDLGQVAGQTLVGFPYTFGGDLRWQRDYDSIADSIDTQPDNTNNCPVPSFFNPCQFDDRPNGGTTYGEVVADHGNRIAVVDVPTGLYPGSDGVKIVNLGDAVNPDLTYKVCNFPYTIHGRGLSMPHCSTLDLAVGAGEWTIDVPGHPIVVTAGAAVSVDEAGPGALSITVDPASVATVLVGQTSVGPGQTVVIQTNFPPSVAITGPPSGTVAAVGAPVTFTGTFTDDTGDTHTAVWDFGSGPVQGTVTEGTGGGTVSDTVVFASAGVYPVSPTVTDNGGLSGSASTVGDLPAFVVVYDPAAGYVTGGGWIQSPLGAYIPNPALTGKATFGFVSKYQKGATIPTGQTEFQFKAGALNFKSAAYEWLVVSGCRAQYKGRGTINGAGDYGFLLTAIDGQLNGGGGMDKFRMKIWDRTTGLIVYDNQLGADDYGDAATAIGGGSIVIHRG